REAADVFGSHGLGGLPEEGAHGKSPKCLGGNLGDFRGFLQRSQSVCLVFCAIALILSRDFIFR
ncbi:hypothetical protein, partial [Neisseria gonorrhoeae]|uniref:hypothetical protein n=3 Tax=Neisseria gonorrhoeae TaxID=485 RepID=UPI003975E23E